MTGKSLITILGSKIDIAFLYSRYGVLQSTYF